MKYGVATLDKPDLKRQTNGITTGEYRSAMKQQSWKMELMNTIDIVMRCAKSKEHFKKLMEQKGYGVRWEEERKYITYTCPNGMKCRDNKLHEDKYRKEKMKLEFEIRGNEESIAREHRESSGYEQGYHSVRLKLEGTDRLDEADFRYAGGDIGESVRAADERGYPLSASEDRSEHRENVLRTGAVAPGTEHTGWEAERAILNADEAVRRIQEQAGQKSLGRGHSFTGELGNIAYGLGALAALIDDEPAEDDNYLVSDRKALAEEIRKKEELGMKM